jgi:hypothetical protein
VVVTNGQFMVPLDFGPGAFNGEARWLAITVQGTPLSPRQEVRAAPYALALGGPRTEPNATSPNVIGGFNGNSVTAGVVGATIGGGGDSLDPNRVTDDYGTVGGGHGNRAGDDAGPANDRPFATVGGGLGNRASGGWATVGGGYYNTASGSSSFATGRQAQALGNGTFVWNDSNPTGAPFASNTNLGTGAGQFNVSGTNSFHVRATGGVRFVTGSGNNVGVYLASGGNTWLTPSHSSLKEHCAPVDGRAVLAALAALPLTTWNLRSEDPSIRHLGPVAEDFYAAFALGYAESAISTGDADGVAFAAIQGLYSLVQEQAALLAVLQAEHAVLAARLAAVEQAGAAGAAP